MEVGDFVASIYINMSDMSKAISNITNAVGRTGLMANTNELDGCIELVAKAWEDEGHKGHLEAIEKRKDELKQLTEMLTEYKLVMEYINNTYKLAVKSNLELSKSI
ncbi:MAG: hypothetical protein IKJ73_03725 [Lachnospiraceae bacterium]|nr:hypothetical protein [Lachnospiraceae bacterium]